LTGPQREDPQTFRHSIHHTRTFRSAFTAPAQPGWNTRPHYKTSQFLASHQPEAASLAYGLLKRLSKRPSSVPGAIHARVQSVIPYGELEARTRNSRKPPEKASEVPASLDRFAWEHSILYIFPYKRFLIISLAVILTVWYRVEPSSVDVRESANPNGNIRGIQPMGAWHQYEYKRSQEGYHPPTAYSSAKQPRCILYCLTSPRRRWCTEPAG
jgi:hypothetical protein